MHRRGVTQREIARHLAIDPTVISRKVSGKVAWTLNDLVGAAQVLGVPLTQLVTDDLVELGANQSPSGAQAEGALELARLKGLEPPTF